MSNKNYNKYSNISKKNYGPIEEKATIEAPVVEEVEAAETPVVEEVEAVETPAIDTIFAKVANCARLNIRKDPNKNSEILTIVNLGDCVEVDPDNDTSSWYHVFVGDIEGYCMKAYIAIQ